MSFSFTRLNLAGRGGNALRGTLNSYQHAVGNLQRLAERDGLPRRSLLTVTAGDKHHKQRRKKKSAADATASPASEPAPLSAPRVDPNLPIPVRKQIQFVRMAKAPPPTPQPNKTKPYRRSITKEEHRQEKEVKEAAAIELSKRESKNFSLRLLYDSYKRPGAGLCPVLLVDGYNILFKWERTMDMMAAKQFQDARDVLLEAMGVYSQTNGVRVVVAFDAMQSTINATCDEQVLSTGVTVVYCVTQEADSYIEAQVEEWLKRGCPQVVVATSDVAHKAVIDSKATTRMQTCYVIPVSGLAKDIAATEARLRQRILEANKPTMSPLGSVVKSKSERTFNVMKGMRISLPPAPGTTWGRQRLNNVDAERNGTDDNGTGADAS